MRTDKTFVMVENHGVADPGTFSLLGISSARDDSSQIGQFGSGAKHAVLIALRAALEIVIYCGKTRVVPFLEDVSVNGTDAKRVCFKIGQKIERTSMTLGFGELDWKEDASMMLRELLSNALDQSGQDWNAISFRLHQPRAKEGTTRVFIEASRDVLEYLANVREYFLHPSGKQHNETLRKPTLSKARLYRKGVFVCESGEQSLLDYNIGENLEIDESRNLDSYRMLSYACSQLTNGCNQDDLRYVLRCIAEGRNSTVFETQFSYYSMGDVNVQQAFRDEFGADACVTSDAVVAEKIRIKGHNVVVLPSSWCQSVEHAHDIRAASELLGAAEKRDGLRETIITEACLRECERVWETLRLADMIPDDKPFPVVKQFTSVMVDGAQTFGFWDRSTDEVWVHDDHATNPKTILEEMIHYISQASDETRDFQDFALRFASRMLFQ